jgi:hypothetical protein
VIVEAEVEIRNTDTNVVTTVKTNGDGLYNIPSLPPGHYLINVRKAGFKSVTVTEVELNIQDNVVRNFGLQVGSITETVTVNGNDIHINTTDGTVSTVVDPTYVKNMPLNGRSFQDLILLTPGTVTQSPQSGGQLGQTGEFSVNGQRTESNYYIVDGVSGNIGGAALLSDAGANSTGALPGATALGTTQALVSIDALQEFRVQSSTYSAEYGRSPGGQISFQTKSGTNQWHGTAYDYLRSDFFDATDWFNNYFGVKGAALRQNDFGGTLGGPVRIPGLYNGKDRTFFFVSYEGLRLVTPRPATPSYVPDLCMRGTASCPTSGPGAGRSPAASALLPVVNAFPLPSPNGLEDAANGFGQFIGSWSNPSSIDSVSVRIDHVVNDKLRLFFRFSDTPSDSTTRNSSTPSQNETISYVLRTYTAGASSGFSNRVSNDLRFNYSSNDVTDKVVIGAFGGNAPVNLAQLSGAGAGSQPIICFCYGPGARLSQGPQVGAQKQWNFVDTVSLSSGRHQFKFGMDYRRLAPFSVQANPVVGYLYFTESQVEANATGLGLTLANGPRYPLYKNFSAYAQDEWRISQRLSLSMGLRWEVNPAPGVTQGQKPYTLEGTTADTLTLAPQGTPLWQTTWYNFAPRLGVAYVLRRATGWETVVRGGGGVFFDTGQQLGSLSFLGPGFAATKFSGLTSFPGSVVVPPIVNPPVPPYGVTDGFSKHLQLPYTLQWNASIEQALGKSQTLTASYVASHGSRLLQENSLAPSNNPNTFLVFLVQNGLTSDYDSLQIQLRRKLSRGLTALASYTWSHCLDYGSVNYQVGYQRGNCDFDVRHNLSTAFSYDVPDVGHNSLANAVLHHWGIDNRFTARTAFPVTLVGQFLVLPNGQQYDAGLDVVSGQPIYLYGSNCDSVLQGLGDLKPGQGCPGGRAINPQAFTSVNSGLGDAPRNFARGFGVWQMDFAVRREFPIYENLKLQFRAEAFNVFNHPNFGSINGHLDQSAFGQATSTLASSLGVLNPLYQTGGPRSMQFALKLVF